MATSGIIRAPTALGDPRGIFIDMQSPLAKSLRAVYDFSSGTGMNFAPRVNGSAVGAADRPPTLALGTGEWRLEPPFGLGWQFPSEQEVLTASQPKLFPSDAPFTLSFWMKWKPSQSTRYLMLTKDTSGRTGILFYLSASKMTLFYWVSSGAIETLQSTTNIVSLPTQLMNVTWVFGNTRHAGAQSRLFINGSLEHTQPGATGVHHELYDGLVFNQQNSFGTRPIVHMTTWDRALVDGEVHEHFHSFAPFNRQPGGRHDVGVTIQDERTVTVRALVDVEVGDILDIHAVREDAGTGSLRTSANESSIAAELSGE